MLVELDVEEVDNDVLTEVEILLDVLLVEIDELVELLVDEVLIEVDWLVLEVDVDLEVEVD